MELIASPRPNSLRGYRWWRVSPAGWLHSPWFGKQRWDADENAAGCLARPTQLLPLRWIKKHPSGAPARDCGCGWYGLHTIPSGNSTFERWDRDPTLHVDDDDIVFGVCEGWGRVLLGTHGWRAERARVVALYVPHAGLYPGLYELIGRRYRVAMVHDRGVLAAEWGPDRDHLPMWPAALAS